MKYTLPNNFPIIKIKKEWGDEWEKYHLIWFDIYINSNDQDADMLTLDFPDEALLIVELNTLETNRFTELIESWKDHEDQYLWLYFEFPYDAIIYRQYGRMKYRFGSGNKFAFAIKKHWM